MAELRAALWRATARRGIGPHRVPPRSAFATYGARTRIERPVLGIVNPMSIALGEDVDIRGYAFLEALAPPGDVVISVGPRSYVGYFARVTATAPLRIGADVLISDRVYLSTTGHAYEDVERPVRDQPLREGRPMLIDDGAWLGIGAVVVGGLRIGRGAVVGAGAVVRDDVPDHSVVVGNPARVVRRYDGERWLWEPRS